MTCLIKHDGDLTSKLLFGYLHVLMQRLQSSYWCSHAAFKRLVAPCKAENLVIPEGQQVPKRGLHDRTSKHVRQTIGNVYGQHSHTVEGILARLSDSKVSTLPNPKIRKGLHGKLPRLPFTSCALENQCAPCNKIDLLLLSAN